MNIDFTSIFMFVTCFPIVFLMYYFLKQEEKKAETGRFLSVSLTSEQLEHVRIKAVRKAYLKLLKYITIFLTIMPITTLFIKRTSISFTVWMIWFLLLITLEFVPVITGNKRLREIKKEEGWYDNTVELDEYASEKTKQAFYENDDNNWKYGIFYYNKKDKRRLINKSIGSGSTINMATKLGKFLIFIAIVSLSIVPFSCAWMVVDEFTPVELTLDENEIVASHRKEKIEINYDEIKDIKLVDSEELVLTKSTGTALDTVCIGRFYIKGYGGGDVCYNPENEDAIIVTLKNEDIILIGDDDNNETKEVYEQVKEKITK